MPATIPTTEIAARTNHPTCPLGTPIENYTIVKIGARTKYYEYEYEYLPALRKGLVDNTLETTLPESLQLSTMANSHKINSNDFNVIPLEFKLDTVMDSENAIEVEICLTTKGMK